MSLRDHFVFKSNVRISSNTSYKDHWCSFFYKQSNKATKKLYFENFEKTPKFGRAVRTHFRVWHPIFYSKRDRLCLIRWYAKFQQQNPFLEFNLSHLQKIILNHSEGGWEGQKKSVPYMLCPKIQDHPPSDCTNGLLVKLYPLFGVRKKFALLEDEHTASTHFAPHSDVRHLFFIFANFSKNLQSGNPQVKLLPSS